MKLIHVYSDDNEYASEDFENLKVSVKKAYENAKKNNDIWEYMKGSYCKAIDFAYVHVTEDFIDFVKTTIGDKDMMRHENFFVVEE